MLARKFAEALLLVCFFLLVFLPHALLLIIASSEPRVGSKALNFENGAVIEVIQVSNIGSESFAVLGDVSDARISLEVESCEGLQLGEEGHHLLSVGDLVVLEVEVGELGQKQELFAVSG